MNEIYSKGLKKNNITTNSDIYHNYESWSLDILDLGGYGPENVRGSKYAFVCEQ